MLLLDNAIEMLVDGYSVEEVREQLRGTSVGEDFPTCSYVEEVLQAAQLRMEQDACQRCGGR
jgi:hypothetical protein